MAAPVRIFLERYRVALSGDGKFHIITLVGQGEDRKEIQVEVAVTRQELPKVLSRMTKQGETVRGSFDAARSAARGEKA